MAVRINAREEILAALAAPRLKGKYCHIPLITVVTNEIYFLKNTKTNILESAAYGKSPQPLKEKEVKRALDKLTDEGLLDRVGTKNCFYLLLEQPNQQEKQS